MSYVRYKIFTGKSTSAAKEIDFKGPNTSTINARSSKWKLGAY